MIYQLSIEESRKRNKKLISWIRKELNQKNVYLWNILIEIKLMLESKKRQYKNEMQKCKYCKGDFLPTRTNNVLCFKCQSNPTRKIKFK